MHAPILALLLLAAATAGCASPGSGQGLIKDQPLTMKVLGGNPPEWVHLRVTNAGDDEITFFPSDLRVVDATGKVKEFSWGDQFRFSSDERFAVSTDLRPGESVEGRVAFGSWSGQGPYSLKYNAFDAAGEVKLA